MPPNGTDVISVLVNDHREVEKLFTRIEALAPGDMRRKVFADLVVRDLVRHAEAEEVYVYPAFRRFLADGDAVADREIAEHSQAELTMKQLLRLGPADPGFDGLLSQLMGVVRQHVAEEERDYFPQLAAAAPARDLDDLGRAVRTVKKVVPTRPHPRSPDRPPLNLLLGPGVGILDRARDLLSGRGRRTPR
jgi:hemerythrin superfamily protein